MDRDIARIAAFLLELTTPRPVARKIAARDAEADALRENPYRGARRDELPPGLRAIPDAGKGVVAFDVKEDTRTVRILSITWGGADRMGRVVGRAARGRG